MSWHVVRDGAWSWCADGFYVYLYAPGVFYPGTGAAAKWTFKCEGFVVLSDTVDASGLEDAQDKTIERVRGMLGRMLASLLEKKPEDWSRRFTAVFRVGPEPKWFEFRPAAPVKLERIEFDVPVRLHGYANGTLVAKEAIPDVRMEMTTGSFCFGPSIHPPHGVVSLRLSVDGEERDVGVVFRGRAEP